jgi:hypothetical protein
MRRLRGVTHLRFRVVRASCKLRHIKKIPDEIFPWIPQKNRSKR